MLNLRRSPISFSRGLPFTTLLQTPGMKISSKGGEEGVYRRAKCRSGLSGIEKIHCGWLGIKHSSPIGAKGAKNYFINRISVRGILCASCTLGRDKETQQGFRLLGPQSPRPKSLWLVSTLWPAGWPTGLPSHLRGAHVTKTELGSK